MGLKQRRLLAVGMPFFVVIALAVMPVQAGAGTNRPCVPSDTDYAGSYARANVTNVFATTQQVSCYRLEVPFFTTGTTDGYTGMTPCPGATTGEDTGAAGPYPTQIGSAAGYPAAGPKLVNDHSESDLRVDPNHPNHVIASSKWFVSAEGYNHVLGFYESFDGGQTWPVQGHIPGYEGFTDNTDPVGAFDGFGNFYELILPYQFYYTTAGGHNFQINQNKEPNPAQPAEAISIAVRPHGSTTATQWITTHNGSLDFVAPYAAKGQEPDKQWITIDTNRFLPDAKTPNPDYNTIYAMWAVFDGIN